MYEVQVRAASQSVVYDNQFKVGDLSIPRTILVKPGCELSFDLFEEGSREFHVIFVTGIVFGLLILFLLLCGLIIRR